MKTLETNDWIILNTIIYKVYTMEDFDEMRKELLEQLKLLVDFDSADFYLASVEDEKKLDRPVMYNCDSNLSEEYEELDYSRGIKVIQRLIWITVSFPTYMYFLSVFFKFRKSFF